MTLDALNTLGETAGSLTESVGTVAEAGSMSAALELDVNPMSESLGMDLDMVADPRVIEPIADFRQSTVTRLTESCLSNAERILKDLQHEADKWEEWNLG